MVNPGSATRLADSSATAQITRNSILSNIPSAHEIEEFFTFAEQQQQRLFMEKYVAFKYMVIFVVDLNIEFIFF